MKKIFLAFIAVVFCLSAYSQADSSINMFNELRINQWAKKSGIDPALVDGYKVVVFNGDTLVRINSGVFQAEEAKVYANGSNMSSALQNAFDYESIKWISFGSDSSRIYIFDDAINAHGKTLKFENGNMLNGTGTIDSLVVDASDEDQIFGSDLTITNLKGTRGYISPKWFGAKGNNVADDTAPIQKSLNQTNVKVQFPLGLYKTTDSLSLNYTSTIRMPDGSLIVSNTTDRPAVIIGNRGEASNFSNILQDKVYEIRVERSTQSDWTDSNSVGVAAYNLNGCDISVMVANRFTVGFKAIGFNNGYAYNRVKLGSFKYNGVNVWVWSDNPDETGWSSQTQYYGGRFHNSNSVNPGKRRIGILISGSYASTMNVFDGYSAELGDLGIPIFIDHGGKNSFLNYRAEGCSDTTKYVSDNQGNDYNISIWGRDDNGKLIDNSIKKTNIHESKESYALDKTSYTTIINVPNVASLINYYRSDSVLNIRSPLYFQNRSTDLYPFDTVKTTFIRLVNGEVLMRDTTGTAGISTGFIDASVNKQFMLQYTVNRGVGDGGGIYVTQYNRWGQNIQNNSMPSLSHYANTLPAYTNVFGGTWFMSNSTANPSILISVADTVKSVRLTIAPRLGAGDIAIKSLKVTTFHNQTTGGYDMRDNEDNSLFTRSVAQPIAGSWQRGAIVINSKPEKDSAFGWICTAEGTFGTLNSVTATWTSNNPFIILNGGSGAKIQVGEFLQVGANKYKVVGVGGDTAYINYRTFSSGTDVGINYAAPSFEKITSINSSGGSTDLAPIYDSLSNHNTRLDSLEVNDTIPMKNLGSGYKVLAASTDTAKFKSIKPGTGITIDSTNTEITINSTGGGGTPGGADSTLQFNDNGTFAGAAIKYNKGDTLFGIKNTPTAYLDLPASHLGRASLRFREGVAPTSPNDGDVWYQSNKKLMFWNGTDSIDLLNAGSAGISDGDKGDITVSSSGATWTADTDAVVKMSGSQTIAGTKTFSSIPVLPASNPTTDNQAVRKKYVDDLLASLVTSGEYVADSVYSFPVLTAFTADTVIYTKINDIVDLAGSFTCELPSASVTQVIDIEFPPGLSSNYEFYSPGFIYGSGSATTILGADAIPLHISAAVLNAASRSIRITFDTNATGFSTITFLVKYKLVSGGD